MAFTSEEKLNYEVEKLIAEVRVLRQPWRQPAFWLAILAFAGTVGYNLFLVFTSTWKADKAEYMLSKAMFEADQVKKDRETHEKIRDDAIHATQRAEERFASLSEVIKDLEAKANPEVKKGLKTIEDEIIDLKANTQASRQELDRNESKEAAAFRTQRDIAKEIERRAFQQLIDGNLDAALKEFEAAEAASKGYNNAYDIARYLRTHHNSFADPAKKKELLQTIATDFSWRAPPDLLRELKSRIK